MVSNKCSYTIQFVLIFCLVTFSSALSGASDGGGNYLKQATMLLSQEKYSEARSVLYFAVQKDPSNLLLRQMLKRVLVMELQNDVMTGMARVKNNPSDTEGYAMIAKAYNVTNDRLSALEILLEGTLENPNAVDLWMLTGQIELQAQRHHEALAVFSEVVRIDEDYAQAHHSVAYILIRPEYVEDGGLSEPLSHALAALDVEPNNPNYLDMLAEIRFMQGNSKAAIRLIKRAIYLAPEEAFYKAQLSRFNYASQKLGMPFLKAE